MIIIQCEFCRKPLNHLLVKQLIRSNNEVLIDVECVNPECQRHNYISEEAYFYLKEDFLDKPLVLKKNMKMPSEMSVIFSSMESCGISWVIKELSQHHEKIFGEPIEFKPKNAEISLQVATKNRFPLPKGWNCVYGAHPNALLLREDPDGNKYDRVIVVHRPLETLKNVYRIRMSRERLNNDFIAKVLEKTKKEYDTVYNIEVLKDPRYMRVDLWDLNQYTEALLNEMMDFLNFPKVKRSPVTRTKTMPFMAMYEAYSSIWDKDFKLTGKLGRVEGIFKLSQDGILEYLAKEVMNPNPKRIELKNILIIGPGFLAGSHLSENIFYAFQDKGYNVYLLDLVMLGWNRPEGRIYQKFKAFYPLSKALEYIDFEPDLILIDEPAWFFYNDVKPLVIYAHREFKRPPKVFHPDIALFWHERVISYFKTMFSPHWAGKIPQFDILDIAVVLDRFKPSTDKKYKGITLLAGREKMTSCVDMQELTAVSTLQECMKEIQHVIDMGIPYVEDPQGGLTNRRFRELLPQCEAIWCCLPARQYVSRRILEAMACKTIVVMKIESQEHEEVLERMGFRAGIHYIRLNELNEMEKIHKALKYEKFEDMVELAYEVVVKRHSFHNRVDFIVELYNDWALQNRGVFG